MARDEPKPNSPADVGYSKPAKKPRPATCRSCGAGIWWTVTADGKKMPVDEEPVTDGGNVVLALAPDGTLKSRVLKDSEEAPEGHRLYKSHFATCPQRDEHRRSR